jgi:hypothetical protein
VRAGNYPVPAREGKTSLANHDAGTDNIDLFPASTYFQAFEYALILMLGDNLSTGVAKSGGKPWNSVVPKSSFRR